MEPTAGLYHRQRSELLRARKGREDGGYMPDGERTRVDDCEESGVCTWKQRKN